MEKIIIIDGNSILNRAFYGMPPLTSSDGKPTGAIRGMVSMILNQINEIDPDYAVAAFDLPTPTFRHLYFKDYKATRKGMPQELAEQFQTAKEVLEALGIAIREVDGYEADDIIGTVSEIAKNNGIKTFIFTGDKDSFQLIDENVTVNLASNNSTLKYGTEEFRSKYGIFPGQFVDAKALMGDNSDNIPGVSGIGEKTAMKLISECNSLDRVYLMLEQGQKLPVGPSAVEKLKNGKTSAYLSQYLSKIRTDVPINNNISDYKYSGFKKRELLSLFTKLEFNSLIEKLKLSSDNISETKNIYLKATCSDISKLSQDYPVSLYYNISDFELEDGIRRTIFLRNGDTRLAVEYSNISDLYPLFKGCYKLYISDMKTLYSFLSSRSAELTESIFDISLAGYVINPGESKYDIPQLAMAYTSTSVPKELDEYDHAQICTELIYDIALVCIDKIDKDGLNYIYYDVELPLVRVLADMERCGFKIDREGLSEFGAQLETSAAYHESQIYDIVGYDFNINSPKQLADVLFEKLKLPAPKKTKTGYSTAADVLEKLRPYHPIIDLIFDYRQLAKLKSTYADGLLKAADENGRIHTSFKQDVTATGRLSSVEPNLQNIPIRTELGKQFRHYFVPKNDDYFLIDADYSQIELRILAHISNDVTMIKAFADGVDIHTVTASQVFGVSLSEVTPEMRKRAKAVNFGIVYGMGSFSLASDLKISRKQAEDYINNYLYKYSGVAEYMKNIVETAKLQGFVTTEYGRRRYIPELKSGKASLRAFGERVAMNSPIQGTAADIIKIAMIKTFRALKEADIDAHLILQVHDELIVEAHKDCVDKASEILKHEMENAVKMNVPLLVDISIGKSWYN